MFFAAKVMRLEDKAKFIKDVLENYPY